MIYITSDTHFNHSNIIKYCNRPFVDAPTMDHNILKNWNDTVTPEDEVYHLGDVGQWFKGVSWLEEVLPKLNGKKYLIPGNHDRRLLRDIKKYFEILPPIHNIKLTLEEVGPVSLVLCHYPIWSWEGMFHGSIHCYGHTHAHVPELHRAAVHVGVDTNNFRPISIEEIVTIVTKRIIENP
jgi:calcineurin-like phosphoesterase family protein